MNQYKLSLLKKYITLAPNAVRLAMVGLLVADQQNHEVWSLFVKKAYELEAFGLAKLLKEPELT